MKLPILYMDNHLMAINKPAGLLVQGDRTGDPSVLSRSKAYLKEAFGKPGNVYLGLVHRLDRPVSGAMVLARTSKAMRRLSEQFRDHRTEKQYVALVDGILEGEGQWKDHLLRNHRNTVVAPGPSTEAKPAVLRWSVRGRSKDVTLVSIQLITGRRHQIRCQFAHRGFPLLGDMRYGAQRPFDGRNLALHSYSLTVNHPTKGEDMLFRAPIPAAWKVAYDDKIEQYL